MEIDYKTIINYLYEDKNSGFKYAKKHIMESCEDFPKYFIDLLKDCNKKFFRYGINKKLDFKDGEKNISFLSSFFTLTNKEYLTLSQNEEKKFIIRFIDDFRNKIKEKEFKFEIKKIEKNIINDRLKNFDFYDGIIIQAIVQYFNFNLLIFDIEKENIKTVFPGMNLNPWKPILLMSYYQENFEPILNDNKSFSFIDDFIVKILTEEEIYYYSSLLDKEYSLLDDVESLKPYISDIDTENIEKTFINTNTEIKKLNLSKIKLNKMKKNELYDLLKQINIKVNKKEKKGDMIEKILPLI
jgi:hypothetical protein